jgi:O-antigen/teichoic acid export membrane protein
LHLFDRIKTVSKDTVIYGIGNATGGIVSFLLLPLYAKFLTPEDYGYLAIFSVFQSVVEITAVFGLSSGLFRYYLMAKDTEEQQIVKNTGFWTQTLFVFFLSILAFPFVGQFSQLLFGSPEFSAFLTMVIATGILSALGGFVFSFMRAERKTILFAAVQVAKVALLALSNIYFVVILHKSYAGIIMGNLIVFAVITVLLLIWFSRFIGFSFSFAYFKKLIIFVSPIYVVNVFFFLLNLSDRFFLNHFLSPTEVGLYSFGSKLGSIVMIGVITPFSTAVVPYALSIAKEDHFKDTYAKIMKYFLLILVFLSLCIFYFSKEIVAVISNRSYADASGVIGPILLSNIFYGLYYNLSIAIDIVERTYLATFVVVTGAVVSLALNYFTIPFLGMYGSVLASCVSNSVLVVFMYYLCQKHFHIHYESIAFVRLLFIVLVYAAFYFWVGGSGLPPVIALPAKISMCILFPIVLYALRVLDGKEREYVRNHIQKLIMFRKQR